MIRFRRRPAMSQSAKIQSLPGRLKPAELQALAPLVHLLRSGSPELTALLDIAKKDAKDASATTSARDVRKPSGSGTSQAQRKGPTTQKQEGWVEVVKKLKQSKPPTLRASAPSAVPNAQAPSGDVLVAEGWSVPVLSADVGQKGVQPGVFLASTELARNLVKELAQVHISLATLSPQKVCETSSLVIIAVKDESGKIQRRTRYMTHLGTGNDLVVYKVPGASAAPSHHTCVLVLDISPAWTSKTVWESATAQPMQAAKLWLQHRALVTAQDSFKPTRQTDTRGTVTLRVLVRVRAQDADTAMRASGTDGVLCRRMLSADERDPYRIVWVDGMDLDGALRQRDRVPEHMGVVANARGYGIRVKKEPYAEAATMLLGDAPMDADAEVYEIDGIPLDWGTNALQEVIHGWQWQATVLRSVRRGKTRTWIVRAAFAPSREFYQLPDGLAVVREAGPRRRHAPVQQQRWQPGTGLHNNVQWPTTWTDPAREKATFAAQLPSNTSLKGESASVGRKSALAMGTKNVIADIVHQAIASSLAEIRAELAELHSAGGEFKRSKTQNRPRGARRGDMDVPNS